MIPLSFSLCICISSLIYMCVCVCVYLSLARILLSFFRYLFSRSLEAPLHTASTPQRVPRFSLPLLPIFLSSRRGETGLFIALMLRMNVPFDATGGESINLIKMQLRFH